ncbi:MAG: hypothetical protein KF682_08575 [Nitrospira sp.]|nr:hypothetical protein [Nitrospira sp.]
MRSDSILADLHGTIQIAFGWTDVQLHRFRLHCQDDGIPRAYGPWDSTDAREVTLAEFSFRHNQRFPYQYLNKAFIPNYGDRYRHGEMISTAFVEATLHQVVSKRMVKKQQMAWTPVGHTCFCKSVRVC